MDSPTTIENQTPKDKPVVISSSGSKKPIFKFSFVNPKILGAMTVLLLMVGVGTGVYLTQQPQQTTTQANLSGVNLSFKPETIEVAQTTEFSLDVFANAGENQITGVDLSIQYDPATLTLKSINPKEFLPKILTPPNIEAGKATVSLGTDGTAGVSGSGVIASLVFESTSEIPSTEITFGPETKIQVLNRTAEGASADTLGKAVVTITPSAQSTSNQPEPIESPTSASESNTSTPNPEPNTDLNGDGIVNAVDRSLYKQQTGN